MNCELLSPGALPSIWPIDRKEEITINQRDCRSKGGVHDLFARNDAEPTRFHSSAVRAFLIHVPHAGLVSGHGNKGRPSSFRNALCFPVADLIASSIFFSSP